jgi:hypothetical protein
MFRIRIRMILVSLVRTALGMLIWILILNEKGKNYPQKGKKGKKLQILKALDVFFWGLKASPVAWTSFIEA